MNDAPHPYPQLARQVIDARLNNRPAPELATAQAPADAPDIWKTPSGCFVSIKNKDGSLRGCIGTFMPTKSTLFEELRDNAVAASTRDPRFTPMQAAELENVRISVDVLGPPERIHSLSQLDPKKYGVIITQGNKRGLLLPDLEGVDTVDRQVGIAAQKAGIRDMQDIELYRFTVERYKEDKGSD
ncbi:AmmeMemoRadiSam system protein A [Desulfovibrio sp. OttesenSCG-928-G15]|nr:AmmeMemoRadiSam system protein A [Desulfovibrio sp. OttesenSCG-928-G15]